MITRKISLLLLIIALMSAKFKAQTSAMDWTKPECGHGIPVHLFDELDSGYVIVQDYVMLGSCVQCGIASEEIRDLIAPFNALYPGKIKFFSCIYDSSATCSDMQSWAQTYNLNNTLFIDGTLEFAYYGNYGMPLVVVLGSVNHSVFAQFNGYVSSDSVAFKNALSAAIAASGINDAKMAHASLSVFPSPATDLIQLQISGNKGIVPCSVFDEFGRLVKSFIISGEKHILEVSDLADGFYFIKAEADGVPVQYSKFCITR